MNTDCTGISFFNWVLNCICERLDYTGPCKAQQIRNNKHERFIAQTTRAAKKVKDP